MFKRFPKTPSRSRCDDSELPVAGFKLPRTSVKSLMYMRKEYGSWSMDICSRNARDRAQKSGVSERLTTWQ